MVGKLVEISVETRKRVELVDVTSRLQQAVRDSGVAEGLLMACVQHTTAGLTINENADPDVVRDLLAHLEKLVPENGSFHHSEGNSDAHIKSSLVGATLTLPISQGQLVLGTWQGVYFCEFDGPRSRRLLARVVG
ncbi:MAG: secondary thiamine-phosphate synthase enzyme YjbQ [candidate division FCPU426 bacterium]